MVLGVDYMYRGETILYLLQREKRARASESLFVESVAQIDAVLL